VCVRWHVTCKQHFRSIFFAPPNWWSCSATASGSRGAKVGGRWHGFGLLLPSFSRRVPSSKRCGTGPEPKIWAASPVENTSWEPNQAARSIPRGHGTEGLPPSWSLHRVMASLWSPRVQVRLFRVLHRSEPWALAVWRRGPHGRPRTAPSPNWNPRAAQPVSGARGCPLNRTP
jgi:hypothetical protein